MSQTKRAEEHRGAALSSAAASRAPWCWLALPALVWGMTGWFSWRPFDLAQGRPFRASSSDASHPITGTVRMMSPGRQLVSTADEASPWLEIDLGSVRQLGSVEVRNRSDCCGERAVPLAIESRGSESEPWTLAARRDRPFLAWMAELPDRPARYVRVRALRKTSLQLEGISIR
ncbi:MAG TPA: hypothetical protein VG963_22695 [Polyangiaceae bacterium]|nr:hypothetical protein [Polyangiaceae bacterium]